MPTRTRAGRTRPSCSKYQPKPMAPGAGEERGNLRRWGRRLHFWCRKEVSGGFHTLQIRIERLLPCRTLGAARSVGKDVRARLQQLRIGATAQHVGHENVGDGEVVGRDELAIGEPAVELLQAQICPTA